MNAACPLLFYVAFDCGIIQIAEETAVKIDAAREGYRSAAIRASVVYFVLDDLARVDPMYQVGSRANVVVRP